MDAASALASEKSIQNEILRVVGSRPDVRLWRANTGVAYAGTRAVRFGVQGQADLSGIIAGGRRLEIEVKSARGRQTPEQRAFGEMIEKFGGVYIVARSVEDVLRRIDG